MPQLGGATAAINIRQQQQQQQRDLDDIVYNSPIQASRFRPVQSQQQDYAQPKRQPTAEQQGQLQENQLPQQQQQQQQHHRYSLPTGASVQSKRTSMLRNVL